MKHIQLAFVFLSLAESTKEAPEAAAGQSPGTRLERVGRQLRRGHQRRTPAEGASTAAPAGAAAATGVRQGGGRVQLHPGQASSEPPQ